MYAKNADIHLKNFKPTSNNIENESPSLASVVGLSLASGFIIVFIAALSCYLYRKRSFNGETHTTLLLKRYHGNDRPISLRKPTAIKSPGTSVSCGPTLKKSPSPTGQKSPPGQTVQQVERKCSLQPTHTGNQLTDSKRRSLEEDKFVTQMDACNNIDVTCKRDRKNEQINGTETEINCVEKIISLGKLYFKLKYNYEKHALCVTIVKCAGLPASKDPNNPCLDPYVKLQLLPEKQHKVKTRVLRKTLDPGYDEDFTFYGINPNQLESITLHFVVLNFDRYSRDDIIGEVIYQLGHLNFDSIEKQISVVEDIVPRNLKIRSQGRGEILISLCYQPVANRLTVVVLKARNLPKFDISGLCDPYVKIYLLYNNQRISKKKTHVKKHTLNPVFNESFIFDIPHNECLDKLSLEFVLLDYDRVTKNEIIGRLEIGARSTGTLLKHWQDIAVSPRRQIAEWHKL